MLYYNWSPMSNTNANERYERITKIIQWKESHDGIQPNCNSSDQYEKQLGIWLNRLKTLNRLGKMPVADIEFVKKSTDPDLLTINRDPIKNFRNANWNNVYNKRDEKLLKKLQQALEFHGVHGKFPEYYDYVRSTVMSSQERYPLSLDFITNPSGFKSWHETEQMTRVKDIIKFCVDNNLDIPSTRSPDKLERQYNRFIIALRKGEIRTHQSVIDYIKTSERPYLLQSGMAKRVRRFNKKERKNADTE